MLLVVQGSSGILKQIFFLWISFTEKLSYTLKVIKEIYTVY